MLSEETALARILTAVNPLGLETVPIGDAFDRVAGEDLYAAIALPRFDNSTMDGYAVRSADARVGARLRVVGEQPAGPQRDLKVAMGETVRIFTGAPLPAGADAVVMQEDVDQSGDEIVIREPVEPGEYIRRRGEDLATGQKVLSAGTRLTGPALAMLMSQGIGSVNVGRMPRVAIVSTGSELQMPGQPLAEGQIYETNGVMIAAIARRAGGVPVLLSPVPDDESKHLVALSAALEQDVVIVSGGVSVGERDLVKPTLERLGVHQELWRVAVKPGKPVLFGTRGDKLVFGLPGNPVSAFVTCLLFVLPAIMRLQGAAEVEPAKVRVRLADSVSNDGERPHYLRGSVAAGSFTLTGRQESHALYGLSRANALLRLAPKTKLPEGSEVEVIPLL
jgi:molybdopterin molybdotransferase